MEMRIPFTKEMEGRRPMSDERVQHCTKVDEFGADGVVWEGEHVEMPEMERVRVHEIDAGVGD